MALFVLSLVCTTNRILLGANMPMWLGAVTALSMLFSMNVAALDKVVHMTSLEWPPYTGANLPDQGETIKQATHIFASMGYTLKVDFYPWARAVKLGLDKRSKYLGYFPEYFDQSLTSQCSFSEPVGFSPLGFAQLVSHPVEWANLNDIAQLKAVGVVRDYVNSPDLDNRIASGNINADLAVSDVENIKKLGGKRVPLIVIDAFVLKYWLEHDPQLAPLKNKIIMHERLLDKKSLYLCFKKDAHGQALLKIFNEGLNKQRMKSFIRESLH